MNHVDIKNTLQPMPLESRRFEERFALFVNRKIEIYEKGGSLLVTLLEVIGKVAAVALFFCTIIIPILSATVPWWASLTVAAGLLLSIGGLKLFVESKASGLKQDHEVYLALKRMYGIRPIEAPQHVEGPDANKQLKNKGKPTLKRSHLMYGSFNRHDHRAMAPLGLHNLDLDDPRFKSDRIKRKLFKGKKLSRPDYDLIRVLNKYNIDSSIFSQMRAARALGQFSDDKTKQWGGFASDLHASQTTDFIGNYSASYHACHRWIAKAQNKRIERDNLYAQLPGLITPQKPSLRHRVRAIFSRLISGPPHRWELDTQNPMSFYGSRFDQIVDACREFTQKVDLKETQLNRPFNRVKVALDNLPKYQEAHQGSSSDPLNRPRVLQGDLLEAIHCFEQEVEKISDSWLLQQWAPLSGMLHSFQEDLLHLEIFLKKETKKYSANIEAHYAQHIADSFASLEDLRARAYADGSLKNLTVIERFNSAAEKLDAIELAFQKIEQQPAQKQRKAHEKQIKALATFRNKTLRKLTNIVNFQGETSKVKRIYKLLTLKPSITVEEPAGVEDKSRIALVRHQLKEIDRKMIWTARIPAVEPLIVLVIYATQWIFMAFGVSNMWLIVGVITAVAFTKLITVYTDYRYKQLDRVKNGRKMHEYLLLHPNRSSSSQLDGVNRRYHLFRTEGLVAKKIMQPHAKRSLKKLSRLKFTTKKRQVSYEIYTREMRKKYLLTPCKTAGVTLLAWFRKCGGDKNKKASEIGLGTLLTIKIPKNMPKDSNSKLQKYWLQYDALAKEIKNLDNYIKKHS